MTDGAPGADASVKLSCRDVWKVYGDGPNRYFRDGVVEDAAALAARMRGDGLLPAAAGLTFDVHVGEIFVIMGLSGSGKSTAVRCVSRLVEPTHGAVLLDGEDILQKSNREMIEVRRRKMGMVFQGFGLMPHLTVYENVGFPLSIQGAPERERRARVEKVIALVGLEGREASYPHQLSGGQQQRVGIARSLAVEPDLWLLDEPFSALDPLIRRQMQDEFLRIQRTLRKSIVFITHDFLEALRIADRIMLMRDGLVVQMGAPTDLIARPADAYVAEFTRDVPMARALTAADALDEGPRPAAASPGEIVDDTATIESLLPLLATHTSGLTVRRDGAFIGRVTPNSVVAALAQGAAASEDAAAAWSA
jgi:glycine betaine/proline transport system ATP-binding protein